jgi:hypothetical protein
MFQFPGYASRLTSGYHVFNMVGCPIRTSADHFLFADPHSFSQLITSFFASESLGILHTLFLTSFIFQLQAPSSKLQVRVSPRLQPLACNLPPTCLPMCSIYLLKPQAPCLKTSSPGLPPDCSLKLATCSFSTTLLSTCQ